MLKQAWHFTHLLVSFRTWYISGIFAATKNDYDMRLITSNEQLDALLPNIQVTVTGETPLIEKMAPFLSATEKWVCDVFTGETVFNTICSLAEASDSASNIEHYSDVRAQAGSNEVQVDSLRAATTQAVEIRCLQSTDPTVWMHFEHGVLFDIVNTIKDNPEEFPEWHSSKVAELYNPTIFENKKESKGFWF